MAALKGKPDIGDKTNTKIIGPLANANMLSDFPDFNDATKLGSGKEMVGPAYQSHRHPRGEDHQCNHRL